MCGIAGRFSPTRLAVDEAWHCRADRLLSHRGPDGSGYYADDRCQLVHRRLALLDLSPTGDQPMGNEDGSIQIIFNGEIYNHAELRAKLAGKHCFRGTSDTEVLVHLYEERGADMLSDLRGMFAFAIYDAPNRRILLGRDRFGIKPLYYTIFRGELVFASEIKAILTLNGFTPEIDRQACYDFLGLSYIAEPATGFKNVSMVPKGHFLSFAGQTPAVPHRYWQPNVSPDEDNVLEDAVESARDALDDAVKRYIVADVPVAALLSGGIDSSLVVSSYARVIGQPLRTFNVRFPDKSYDETSLAAEVAKQYGTSHTTIDVDAGCVTPELAERLLGHFDQPFADTSLFPMYLVSRAIRDNGIICTLSGDGGDEVFGGYDCFWRAKKLVTLARMPGILQSSISNVGRWSQSFTLDIGRQLHKAMELARNGRSNMAVLLSGLSNYLTEFQKQQLVLPDARAGLSPVHRLFENPTRPAAGAELDELSRRMTENLFDVSLPSDMLRKVDMMSMLASIEVRVPLLDEGVVDLGLTLPHRLKTDGRQCKRVLRSLADRWLPPAVAGHPKHGFSIPLDILLTDDFFEMLEDTLLGASSRTRALFNSALLRQWLHMLRLARAGKRQSSIGREGLYQRIFMALSMEFWMRKYSLSW